MRPHQIATCKALNELPKELFDLVKKKGLVTGSIVFGGYKEGSDVDFIIFKGDFDFEKFNKYITPASESVVGGSFYAFYGRYKDFLLNFIVTKDQSQFDAWKKAHNLVVEMVDKSETFAELMKEKKFRVKQFQMLRDHFGWAVKKIDRENINDLEF